MKLSSQPINSDILYTPVSRRKLLLGAALLGTSLTAITTTLAACATAPEPFNRLDQLDQMRSPSTDELRLNHYGRLFVSVRTFETDDLDSVDQTHPQAKFLQRAGKAVFSHTGQKPRYVSRFDYLRGDRSLLYTSYQVGTDDGLHGVWLDDEEERRGGIFGIFNPPEELVLENIDLIIFPSQTRNDEMVAMVGKNRLGQQVVMETMIWRKGAFALSQKLIGSPDRNEIVDSEMFNIVYNKVYQFQTPTRPILLEDVNRHRNEYFFPEEWITILTNPPIPTAYHGSIKYLSYDTRGI